MPAGRFQWPVRVYYEDTDAAGIVYHANYLRFMERARTEWLRALGFEQTALVAEFGIVFVIRRAYVDYHRAARFNDAVTVLSEVVKLGAASIDFDQCITNAADEILCRAANKVACVDAHTLKPRRIPLPMTREFPRAN